MQNMEIMAKGLGIKFIFGEAKAKMDGHILITNPGYVSQKLKNVKSGGIDFSALKMIVLDEADELFIQDGNMECFTLLKKQFDKN
jgi:superfamily II DNA/RNA helicase